MTRYVLQASTGISTARLWVTLAAAIGWRTQRAKETVKRITLLSKTISGLGGVPGATRVYGALR